MYEYTSGKYKWFFFINFARGGFGKVTFRIMFQLEYILSIHTNEKPRFRFRICTRSNQYMDFQKVFGVYRYDVRVVQYLYCSDKEVP
jgi:hypothetical protein